MNVEICVALSAGELIMDHLVYFVHRNARVVAALSVVFACVSTAGAIGWLTAPI